MTSKRYTEQQLQDLLVLGIAAANAELAALKAKQGTGTTSDNYRAELYDLLLQVGRDMGYPNVTMALTELATLKARAGEPIAILDFDDLFPNSHWSQPEHRFMWQIELDEIRALPKRDIPLYTTPQPTQEVSALVAALYATNLMLRTRRRECESAEVCHILDACIKRNRDALAQYAQGGGK